MLGLLGLLVAMPVSGYGADLTIGNTITGNGDISQTGTISGSQLRAVNGSYYVGLTAPGGLSANKTWTLPAVDGTDGQVLKTNGSGVLSWVTATGGGGSGTVTSVATGAGLTGGPITTTGTVSIATGGVTGTMLASGSVSDSKITGLISSSKIGDVKVDIVKGNSAFGYTAFISNVSGYYNTAIGEGALHDNASGLGNTAIGFNALVATSDGFENSALGWHSLLSNTHGSYNTAMGGNALPANVTGNTNNAFGDSALFYNSSGSDNTAVGAAALGSNTTGTYNTAIGNYADVTSGGLTNAMAIGYNAKVESSNKVRIGNTAVNVIGGQVAWSNLSDIREKKDIQDISLGLDFITSLRPVEYRMKQGNDRTDMGFIAQEIESLLGTGYNVLGIGEDETRTLSLRYTDFIAPMVKAIQEQQQIIEKQNDTISQMRKELDELKTLLLGMAGK